jgi:ABC-2 type transport system permease protein
MEMNAQRVFALIKKELRKTVRDSAVLFLIFLFPIIFVFTFSTAFGGSGGEQPVYNIGIIDMDEGNASQILLAALSDTKILNLNIYGDDQTAQNDLSQGKIQAVILIPKDFSLSLASYQAAPDDPSRWINTTLTLYLDKGSLIATQAIPPIVQQIITLMTGYEKIVSLSPLRLETAHLVDVKKTSAFEFMAPGMFTFASIYIIFMVAQSFVQDRENGMMKRIRITPITPTEFMSGQILSYAIIALVQAALVFTMLYLLGFRPNVDLHTYAFTFFLLTVFSFSNVGFGLIVATIAKTPGAASGISFLFVLPQLFLGTFVGASLSSSVQVASRFVPNYYVTDALTSLFLRGAAITSQTVLFDLMVVSASCAAILALGVTFYAKCYKD